jgi:tetratricopeptide (TPR) repeat protein
LKERNIDKSFTKKTAEAYMILGIYERQKENYQEALKHFKELEVNAESGEQTLQARSNIMRISNRLGNGADALNYAKKVVEADKVSDDLKQEARMIIARAYFAEEKYEQAMEELQRLRKVNSEIGAEAKYTVASIYYKKGEYKKCEKAIFDLVDEAGAYDYWLTKGFILLADNYTQLGNVFQAKQTLQSVLDHHEKDELYQLAESKLNALNEETKPDAKQDLPEPDIQFNGNKKEDGLFEDAPKKEQNSKKHKKKDWNR